jgi:hypothetical protein
VDSHKFPAFLVVGLSMKHAVYPRFLEFWLREGIENPCMPRSLERFRLYIRHSTNQGLNGVFV